MLIHGSGSFRCPEILTFSILVVIIILFVAPPLKIIFLVRGLFKYFYFGTFHPSEYLFTAEIKTPSAGKL
jgi:hypothetical protein